MSEHFLKILTINDLIMKEPTMGGHNFAWTQHVSQPVVVGRAALLKPDMTPFLFFLFVYTHLYNLPLACANFKEIAATLAVWTTTLECRQHQYTIVQQKA